MTTPAMTLEDILIRKRVVERLYGSPCATLCDLAGTRLYWERVNRYRNAEQIDGNSACSSLAWIWRSRNTLHGNILRHRFTPLEWTLMEIWPRHDRMQSAHAWRIVRAKIDALLALLLNAGNAGDGDPDELKDGLVTLYGIAFKHQISFEHEQAASLEAAARRSH